MIRAFTEVMWTRLVQYASHCQLALRWLLSRAYRPVTTVSDYAIGMQDGGLDDLFDYLAVDFGQTLTAALVHEAEAILI